MKAQIDEYTKKFEAEGLADTRDALPFVGSYLRAKQSANGKTDGTSILFRDDALLHFCSDLWNAGQETTSTTLSFAVLYLLLDVEVQSKMQQELDSVVAVDEKVTVAHKSRLPYTNAVVNEREEEFSILKEVIDKLMKEYGRPDGATVTMFSALRKYPIFSNAFKRLYGLEKEKQGFLAARIIEYTKKFEAEGLADTKEALSFVGSYLRAKQLANGKVNNGSILFRDEALIQFCDDLWQAGQDTTSTTLSFAVLYLLLDVDVQSKMQEELYAVVGSDENVTIAHKAMLPYTNAVVNEVQRMCNLLPQNLYHRTMRDVEINGYKIPKSTNVVPQICCVLFDEKIFPEPNRFKPERFIDENGQLIKVEELIPFSIGKRICLGESLARMELFLFIANFFHTFKVRPIDPLNPPTSEKVPGLTVHTKPYKVRLELRNLPENSQMQNGY